jgi:hypothetical protein
MKNLILLLFCIALSYVVSAQTLTETEVGAMLCNDNIETTDATCVDVIPSSPITINGTFGNTDDGTDNYQFPNGSNGTVTFTFNTASVIVSIIPYTGAIGSATTGTPVAIANGGSFTFNAAQKYVLYVERVAPSVSNYSIVLSGSLPVELVSFKGISTEDGISLQWRTAQEKNSKSFEIQQSTDALNYQTIGGVDALGNSQTGKTYQFLDQDPREGINYYRLKQIDFDNSFTLIRPISVIFARNESDLVLYPNPSSQVVKLPLSFVQGAMILNVYNLNGVLMKQFPVLDGAAQQISVEDLNPGTYLIEAISLNTQNRVKQFVKK